MAGSIYYDYRLRLVNGALTYDNAPARTTLVQTTQYIFSVVLSIGTTEESPAITDVTTLGIAEFTNLDSTNYVQIGASAGVYLVKLTAGDPPWTFRLNPGITLFMKANTAACKVKVVILDV